MGSLVQTMHGKCVVVSGGDCRSFQATGMFVEMWVEAIPMRVEAIAIRVVCDSSFAPHLRPTFPGRPQRVGRRPRFSAPLGDPDLAECAPGSDECQGPKSWPNPFHFVMYNIDRHPPS